MKKLSKKACAVMLAAFFTLSSSAAPVFAAESANMKSPAKDAAYVIDLAGIQNAKGTNLTGTSIAHNEGIVIRQSRIENGKIIIPKSGLYYTSRSGRAEILTGWKVFLLGKEYTVVDTKDSLEVIKDVNMQKGGVAPVGKSKALELSSTSTNGNGFEAAGATFQILKPSGNYYGSDFPVNPDAKLKNITSGVLNKGTARAAGSYLPGQFNFTEYYGTNVAVSGQSYVVADKATDKGAHVVEFGTGNMYEVLLSDKAPQEMLLGKGEKANLGDYTVTVTDITENTAAVELTGKDGKAIKKVFGPLTEELMAYLPADEIARQKLIVRSEKEDVALQLDAFRKPFHDGKVALVGYTDLFKVTEGGPWAKDTKFIARPDTWSTCSELGEIMIENPEEIILDSTNNVFVGPNGYFKIVIDQFDGTTVKAWHVEDSKGNKTANLADRAQGKHIDVMVNGGNRTVAHFVDRYQADIMKYQQTQIQKLSAAKEAPAPAPAAAPTQNASNGVPVSVPVGIAVVAIAIIAFQATRNKPKGL